MATTEPQPAGAHTSAPATAEPTTGPVQADRPISSTAPGPAISDLGGDVALPVGVDASGRLFF